MKTLVLAEHNGTNISAATLCVVEAAKQLSREIDLLVTNNSCVAVIEEAKSIEGVSKVLNFSHEKFANEMAEDVAACVVSVSSDYDFFLASSSTSGKNNLPRAAALLDIQQISEVTDIIDDKTFKKPIYAGSCIATVQSNQDKNALTIRTTSFEKAAISAGYSTVEETNVPETE